MDIPYRGYGCKSNFSICVTLRNLRAPGLYGEGYTMLMFLTGQNAEGGIMKRSIYLSLALLISSCASSGAFAQSADQPYAANAFYSTNAEQPPSNHPKVDGVVRRIEMATQKITLKHDEIPNLDMGAMTMSFAVPEMSMIQGLSRGDSVQFQADEIDGVLTVIWIEKQ